jgi:hypothetical protein
MYKALSIQKIRQKYKNADITQDTLLMLHFACTCITYRAAELFA